MRQRGGCHQGRIGDIHAVVHLVAFLQTAKDSDGVLNRGLADEYFLETTLQRRVFFHVLPVLIQRGSADAVQLTPRQGGFEHIAGIHGAFGFTGAYDSVNLIDKQDDIAFLLTEIVQQCFQAFFKLTSEFCTGDQCTHVQ